MPNSSYVVRMAPLAEALAHFVLRVDVVCAMQTIFVILTHRMGCGCGFAAATTYIMI